MVSWLADLPGDVRYAVRSLRRNRGFAAAAILTIALGIGATSAVFSIVHAVLIAPLPYPDPDRLVAFMSTFRGRESQPGVSAPKFSALQRAGLLEDAAAYRLGGVSNLTNGAQAEQIKVGRVSSAFFRLFGAHTVYGRTFLDEEDREDGAPVAVVSHPLWLRLLGASNDAIGQPIVLDGVPHTVIGVLEQGFDADPLTMSRGPRPDVWVPLRLDPASTSDAPFLAVGRLKRDTTLQVAQEQASASTSALRRALPSVMPDEAGLAFEPLHDVYVRGVRPALLLVLAAVALVLLIVCVNTANLLLIRASARQREMAIRLAAGANRFRLVRQLLTESLVLSLAGATLGVYLALVGLRALLLGYAIALPPVLTRTVSKAVAPEILVFTILVSIAAGVVFGLVPALQASRADLDRVLRAGGDRAGSAPRRRLRAMLAVSEIALALMLLVCSGLLVRSFIALRHVDPGFEAARVLSLEMAVSGRPFATVDGTSEIVRDALRRVDGLPSVEATAATLTGAPLAGMASFLNLTVPGRSLGGPYFRGGYLGGWQVISPRYFEVLNIRVIAGRTFSERDARDSAPVVIINQAMSRQFWPDESPLGRAVLIGEGAGPDFEDPTPRQIVGVASDVRHVGLEFPPRPTVYVPLGQLTAGQMRIFNAVGGQLTWLVRSPMVTSQSTESVRHELQQATGGLPIGRIRSMAEVSSTSTAPTEFNMWLMVGFGLSALLLAAIGVFGVMAYSVRERTREIGVRIALGASRPAVRSMVLREGIVLSGAGLAIGAIAAVGLARVPRAGCLASCPMTGSSLARPRSFSAPSRWSQRGCRRDARPKSIRWSRSGTTER